MATQLLLKANELADNYVDHNCEVCPVWFYIRFWSKINKSHFWKALSFLDSVIPKESPAKLWHAMPSFVMTQTNSVRPQRSKVKYIGHNPDYIHKTGFRRYGLFVLRDKGKFIM